MNKHRKSLFYEWNEGEGKKDLRVIEINDETLRDGIQATGITYPTLEGKLGILREIHNLGINAACIGFPASGPEMVRDVEAMLKCVKENKWSLDIACAARTVESDIKPIVELSQKFGIPIGANIFVGSSPIRQFVEGWNVGHIQQLVERAVTFAVNHDLSVCFITEDTTRSLPGDLEAIYRTAIRYGARRICVADTVGYATPQGVKKLVGFIKSVVEDTDPDVVIDWHGHNDRGLSLANALAAVEAGVHRVHATGLGIGERTGNTSMEQLLMNLKLAGLWDFRTDQLKHYCSAVSEACGVTVPLNYPIVGSSAFSTATGVHAAAIIKAKKMKDEWLADRIYSSVPAGELGFEQKIELGPMSGKSNVRYLMEKNNIPGNDRVIDDIFNETRRRGNYLTAQEFISIFKKYSCRQYKR